MRPLERELRDGLQTGTIGQATIGNHVSAKLRVVPRRLNEQSHRFVMCHDLKATK